MKIIVIILFHILVFLIFLYFLKETRLNFEEKFGIGNEIDFEFEKCKVEKWNQISTDEIPYSDLHDVWLKADPDNHNQSFHTTLSPFAAYVYPSHITVSLSSESFYRANVTCRYFDCHRNEILPSFNSRVFPQSTVHCGRRPGAKYMSVTKTVHEHEFEIIVPLQTRVTKQPEHFFTVCLATLYGDESKFLQIAEFIEHYKLQGATFFHVYVATVSNYDRRILSDYVRRGEIEVIEEMDYYSRDDFMWHDVQVNDCHHRSRNFARWTAFVDIDERMEMRKQFPTIVNYLKSIKNPSIGMTQWQIEWVIKNETSPKKYENDAQINDQMTFRRFRNTSQIGDRWMNPKAIIRPERYAQMKVHLAKYPYLGNENDARVFVGDLGVVKHYRNIGHHDTGIFKFMDNKFQKITPFYIAPQNESMHSKLLTMNVLDRVRKVYGAKELSCEQRKLFYAQNGRLFNENC